MIRKFILVAWIAIFSISLHADGWSGQKEVEELNIGGNGLNGTYVSLKNYSFTGCSSTTAFLDAQANLNYKEIYSALLAVSMSGKTISVYTSGCGGNGNSHPAVIALRIN